MEKENKNENKNTNWKGENKNENNNGYTPLNKKVIEMLEERDYKKIKKFLDDGFDINYIFADNMTPLFKAVSNGDVELVEFLLENGANPNFIPHGNNAFFFTGFASKKDEEVVKLLVKYNTWFLPFWPDTYTIVESLENAEHETEETLDELDEEYNSMYRNYNSPRSYGYRGGGQLAETYLLYSERLKTIRNLITLLRPLKEKFVKKLQINFSGQNRVETIEIDERADVKTLKYHISNYFLKGQMGVDDFNLVMPSFRMKNKSVMDNTRALSDYGIRDETRLVVSINISSQRHWNADGGKRRKTRKSGRKAKKTRKH